MIKFLKSLFGINKPEVKGEVVYGKRKDQVRPCYIPFSKNSGDNPVIATEQYATPKVGCKLESVMCLEGVQENRLQLAAQRKGDPTETAPKDLGSSSQYMVVGGREYGENSYRGIGFGYLWSDNGVAPVFVGSQEKNGKQSTNADFVVATREKVGNTDAPIVRFRVDATGQILGEGDYAPKLDNALTTKKYVDDAVKKGGGGGSVYASNVSCPAMSPSGTATNVEGILRELNARIYNIEKQMPH